MLVETVQIAHQKLSVLRL